MTTPFESQSPLIPVEWQTLSGSSSDSSACFEIPAKDLLLNANDSGSTRAAAFDNNFNLDDFSHFKLSLWRRRYPDLLHGCWRFLEDSGFDILTSLSLNLDFQF